MRTFLAIVLLAPLVAGCGSARAARAAEEVIELQPMTGARGCAIRPPKDTAVVQVHATLTPADSSLPIPRDYATALLFEVARRLRLPRLLPVPVYEPYARLAGARAVAREPGYQALAAEVELRLRRRQPPDEMRFVASSLSPTFDDALLGAVQEIVRDRLGGLPDSLQRPRLAKISIDTRVVADSQQTVLFEMRVPVIAFDSLVSWEAGNPRPTHPRHLREREIEGRVVLRFVVDADGQAVIPSIRVLQADDPAFVDAVAVALMFSRFRPAMIDGCRVASVVEMMYNFSLY